MIQGYRLHQMQGNQIYGFHKSGYLLKKSEGKMRVKAWRKRRCEISDGSLFIYHSDETEPPTKLNLLTCQVEDEHDITAWVYVLINCKDSALKRQFDDPNSNNKDCVDFPTDSWQKGHNDEQQTLPRLGAEQHVQQQLIRQVQALAGNDRCVDCSTTKDRPTWLSTNLGVLVCIECSGIHRDLGVHISRIQSLTLDNINTSQLLIAHNMGNDLFNEIYESKLRQLELLAADIASPNFDTPKLKPNSSMEQRCEFIKSKYIQRKFCQNIHLDDTDRAKCLKEAVISKDLRKLVQLFGEGFDIASCISNLDDYDGDESNRNASPDQRQHSSENHNDCQHSNRALNEQQQQQQYNQFHLHNQSSSHQHHHPNHHNLQHNCNHRTQQQQQQSYQQRRQVSSQNDSISTSRTQSMDDSMDMSMVYQPSKMTIADQDTSIHLALSCQASRETTGVQFECDLFILDFIIQNSRAINKQNALGETPLHYCAKLNLPECMKLLLKCGADAQIRNSNNETPLDIIQTLKLPGYKQLIEILGVGDLSDSANTSASSGGCFNSEKMDPLRAPAAGGSVIDINNTSTTHLLNKSASNNVDSPLLPSSAMKKIADEVIAYHAQSAEKKRHSISSFKPRYSTESNSIL